MLNLDCIVQRDPDVIAAEADQDLVMVSIANGFYYGVSDVAREIWEAIEHPKKISDLIDDLTATYNIDRSKCEAGNFIISRRLADRASVAGERWTVSLSSGPCLA